jgi:hypothetical protein
MRVSLAHGVYAAEVDQDVVFLDCRQNRYLCLPAAKAAPLIVAIKNGCAASCGLTEPLLHELENEGLLVIGREPGRRTLSTLRRDTLRDCPTLPNVMVTTRLRDVLGLIIAGAITLARLKLSSSAQWFRAQEARSNAVQTPGEVDRAIEAALKFERLRPLVPGSSRCLPKSMLLLEFLHLQGVRAQWVFGVRTYPFAAHCWVECGGFILNDTAEHAAWYTPIAVI